MPFVIMNYLNNAGNSSYFHNLEKVLVEEGMESDYISFPLKLSK